MQGIRAKDHENMLEAFKKFEALAIRGESFISAEAGILTRAGVEELTDSYRQFQKLFAELKHCAKRYKNRQKAVQSVMYKSIRKMNAGFKKEKRFQ